MYINLKTIILVIGATLIDANTIDRYDENNNIDGSMTLNKCSQILSIQSDMKWPRMLNKNALN